MSAPSLTQFLHDNPGLTKYDFFDRYGNPGGHKTAERRKWEAQQRDNKATLKTLNKQPRFQGITVGGTRIPRPSLADVPARELAADTARLVAKFAKRGAYWQGFVTKIAEKLDTLKNTSVLKPCIKYNKRSLMINLKKPIR